jgi:hypothetical protein
VGHKLHNIAQSGIVAIVVEGLKQIDILYWIEKDMRGIALKAQLFIIVFTAFAAFLKPTTRGGLLKTSERKVQIHLKIDEWSLLFSSDGAYADYQQRCETHDYFFWF